MRGQDKYIERAHQLRHVLACPGEPHEVLDAQLRGTRAQLLGHRPFASDQQTEITAPVGRAFCHDPRERVQQRELVLDAVEPADCPNGKRRPCMSPWQIRRQRPIRPEALGVNAVVDLFDTRRRHTNARLQPRTDVLRHRYIAVNGAAAEPTDPQPTSALAVRGRLAPSRARHGHGTARARRGGPTACRLCRDCACVPCAGRRLRSRRHMRRYTPKSLPGRLSTQ